MSSNLEFVSVNNTKMISNTLFFSQILSATNTATQSQIYIYTLDGMQGSIIKYREGFISQHLSPISCLAHHPYKVCVH